MKIKKAITASIFFIMTLLSPFGIKSVSPEERPAIEVTETQQRYAGIKTYKVKPILMKRSLRTVGTIKYDERLLYTITTKFEGWIEKLHLNYTGQYIKKGSPVAEIYSPELLSTQEEFLSSLRYLKRAEELGSEILIKDAERVVRAARQRLSLWDIPEEEIKRIETTGTPLKRLTILSPVDGYVIKKYVVEGSRVMPGERLFDIADLRQVWIIAEIYEQDIGLLKDLKSATIRLSSLR